MRLSPSARCLSCRLSRSLPAGVRAAHLPPDAEPVRRRPAGRTVRGGSASWPASKGLDLSDTHLTELPAEPRQLASLHTLDLEGNGGAHEDARRDAHNPSDNQMRSVTPTTDANGIGSPDPLSDAWVLFPQVRNYIGHLCGIF